MGIIPFFTRLAGRAQSGYIFHYAFAMVLGIAVLITWMTHRPGARLMDNLLSIITFLPLVAALILALFLRGDDEAAQRNAKWLALIATSATFLISLFLLRASTRPTPASSSSRRARLAARPDLQDGRRRHLVLFVMLTTFLMPLTIAACWDVKHRVKEYMIAFLVLETLMIGVFWRSIWCCSTCSSRPA
jgi:cytochrome bd-type quinol oxidase subunit 2